MFVGREKELNRLNNIAQLVRTGSGVFLILEGAAGIGKSSLLEEFEKSIGDFQVYRARGTAGAEYIPYYLFTRAFDVDSIVDIPRIQERQIAEKIVEKLKEKKTGTILVDEPGGEYALRIARMLGEPMVVSPRYNEHVFLTELDVDDGVKPYEIESKLMYTVGEFVKNTNHPVILLDNLNYLVSVLGFEKVLFFLHDLINSTTRGFLIVSGDLGVWDEEKVKKLQSLFSEVLAFQFSDMQEDTVIFMHQIPDGCAIFSSDGTGDYVVSESSELRPSLLNFQVLDAIIKELKGRDVVLRCMRTIMDYNTPEKVYVWLKYIRDVARINGRRVYVYMGDLSRRELMFFRSLAKIGDIHRDMEMYKYKIFDDFLEFLRGRSGEKSVAIILEDAQWADVNSLELVDYVARNIPHRVLFILTYRGEEIALTSRAKMLKRMLEYENTEIMRLGPLKKEDAERLMDLLGVEDKDGMYERSGGHPLMIIVLYKFSHSDFVPDTIMESIEFQISRLDDTTIHYLRFLSVLGPEVERGVVEDLLGESWLEDMGDYGDILDVNGAVRFKSSMVWDYLYRTLPPDLKSEMHYKIGDYYSTRSIFKAAYHYYRSRRRKALEYLIRAAEKSVEMYAIENGIEFYRKALEIAEKFGLKEEKLRILENLGDMEELTGRFTEAISDYQAILDTEDIPVIHWKISKTLLEMGRYDEARKYLDEAVKRGDAELQARMRETLGSLNLRQGRLDEAERYYREYLDYALKTEDRKEIANAYSNLAVLKFHQSKHREALEYAKKAMENAQKIANYRVLFAVYNILGVIYDVLGKPKEALEKYQKEYELAKLAGDLRGMAYAYNNIGILYYSLGDLNMVKENLEKAMELHIKMGNLRNIATSYFNLGGVYADIGDYRKSVEYLQKALALFKKLHDHQFEASTELWLGIYGMRIGDYRDAMEHIKRARKIADENNYVKVKMMAKIGMARVWNNMGKYEEAMKELSTEPELIESMKSDMDAYPEYIITLCETMVMSSRYEESESCLQELKALAERNEDRELIGDYYLFRAILKVKRGENGDDDFKRGIELVKNGGYVFAVAESYYNYGLVLLECDNERGKEYLREAKRMFEEMELESMVEEIGRVCGEC